MLSRSTVIVLFGSSVPIWILCCIVGVLFALVLREILIVTGSAQHMPGLSLFHPSVALIATISVYAIWVGGLQ